MNSKVEAEDKEAARINAGIEKQIRNDKKTYDRTVKMLLLGLYQSSVFDELTAHY
jgi:guanine nucleotide-binding protein subunit alpha